MKKLLLIPFLLLTLLLAACGGTTHHSHAKTVPAAPKATQEAAKALTDSFKANQPVLSGGIYHAAGFGQPLSMKFPSKNSRLGSLPTYAGYDSVNASADPYGAAVLSCYATGSRYANCPAVAARHPQHILTVAVASWIVARCADIEPSDLTPSQAGSWAHMVIAHGITHPCFYASGSWMPSVEANAQASGIPHCTPTTATQSRPCFLTHVAEWDNNPAIPFGQDGIQWKSLPSVDFDTYYRYFFASTPAPKPPKPKLTGTANMGAQFDSSWVWGIHGTKGHVRGQRGYGRGIAAEVQIGKSHKVRIKGMKATAPPISGKHIKTWWPLQHVLFPMGIQFNFKTATWKAWSYRGHVPALPKGCDRLSAQVFMATHGSHAFKPEIRHMKCDAGPLFGVKK